MRCWRGCRFLLEKKNHANERRLGSVLAVPPLPLKDAADSKNRLLLHRLLKMHYRFGASLDLGPRGEWIFVHFTGGVRHVVQVVDAAVQHLEVLRAEKSTLQLRSQGVGISFGEVALDRLALLMLHESAVVQGLALANASHPGEILLTERAMLHFFEHLPEGFTAATGQVYELPLLDQRTIPNTLVYPVDEQEAQVVFLVGQDVERRPQDAVLYLQPVFQCEGPEGTSTILVVHSTRAGEAVPPIRSLESMRLPPPQVVGGFRIVEVMVEGVTEEVWKATTPDGEIVALKRFAVGPERDAAAARLLCKQAFDLGTHRIPGICRAFGYGSDDRGWFVALEYVDGTPIEKWLPRTQAPRGGLPFTPGEQTWTERLLRITASKADEEAPFQLRRMNLDEAARFFARVCDSLEMVHRLGVLHLNIHPGDVIVKSDGKPILTDFGSRIRLASLVGEKPSPPPPAFAYAAPEVANQSTGIDERADVYSLGAVMYHYATGCRHFQGTGDVRKDVVRLANWRPSDPAEICRAVPRHLADILLKALEPRADARYSSIVFLREDLLRFAKGRIPLATDERNIGGAAGFARRHPMVFTLVALAVVLLSVGIFGSISTLEIKARKAATAAVNLKQDVTSLTEEQKESAEELKGMAPNLLELGLWRINQGAYSKALELTDQILKADPKLVATRMFRAQTYIVKGDFQSALGELDAYLVGGGRDPFTGILADTCRDAINRGMKPFGRFSKIFVQQGANSFAQAAASSADILKDDYEMEVAKAMPTWDRNASAASGWPEAFAQAMGLMPNDKAVTLLEDGTVALNLSRVKDLDLEKLRNIPIAYLSVQNTSLSDLTGLTAFPLKFLNISRTPVVDLTPLRNSRLEVLQADQCTELSDLSPLSQLHLTYLSVEKTKVKNLSPLHGMPLRLLNIAVTPVDNLNALSQVPLLDLDCRMTLISSLEPLRGMPLKRLCFDGDLVQDISPLHNLPLFSLFATNLRADDLSPLTGLHLKFLSLQGANARNISALKGMPLEYLDLAGAGDIADLSPLKGMPLRWLKLQRTNVKDLSPLAGMPLEMLDISETPVADLSPLKGMNLHSLSIHGTHVTDLSPLKKMPLAELVLAPDNMANGPSQVRAIRTLEKIGLVLNDSGEGFLNVTPEQLDNLYGVGKQP